MSGLNIGAKPFIKWPGSKSQHVHILTQALPADFAEMSNVTYIEPFVGGGSLLFHMLQTYPNIKRAIINDNNLDLIRAYNTGRDRAKEMVAELKRI
jgi:DNA adenine methylase